jgi:hypothetical protein
MAPERPIPEPLATSRDLWACAATSCGCRVKQPADTLLVVRPNPYLAGRLTVGPICGERTVAPKCTIGSTWAIASGSNAGAGERVAERRASSLAVRGSPVVHFDRDRNRCPLSLLSCSFENRRAWGTGRVGKSEGARARASRRTRTLGQRRSGKLPDLSARRPCCQPARQAGSKETAQSADKCSGGV